MLHVAKLCRQGLAPVSFTLNAGECLAVRGPSGAGKTLLLRSIADLDPNQGDVYLDDCHRSTIPAPQWRRMVGYLPAEPGWWGDLVGDHFPDWDGVLPLVRRLGLPDDAKSWPLTRPSTGERMRLALIRALAAQPRVLMLDEPTAALDSASVGLVEALMAERREQGMAVLWVSHDPAQARRVAHRCLTIEAGTAREDAWTPTSP